MINKQKINRLAVSLFLILFFVSLVNAQQTINSIDDLTNLLKQKSQVHVEKFDSFYQNEVLTRRCSENETMNKWYTEKRKDIGDFSSNLALNLYNNASAGEKEATLSFLIDEIENLTQDSLEMEIFVENLTTQVCNGIPIKIYSIDELLNLIKLNNQKSVDKYNNFLNKEINIYEECQSPSFYEQRRQELRNFNVEWVKSNYENATDKEYSLRILNEMIWDLDNSTASLEISYENVTRNYCDEMRESLGELYKRENNYSWIFWVLGLGLIVYIIYHFTKKGKRK
ncbi:MAG: hypothetical protein KC516_04745 [Nanoarchaeota archaeon]|nr:hypothetical protein [Nanoarchaeota archaeon]